MAWREGQGLLCHRASSGPFTNNVSLHGRGYFLAGPLASLVLLSNAEVISAPRKVLRTSPCHCVPLRQVRQVRRGVPHACGARRSAGPSGARPCAASVGHQRGRFASERRASSRCLYIKSLDFKLRKNLWRLQEGSGNGEGTCSGDPSTKASRGLRTTVRPCSICVGRSALPHARGQCEEDGSAPGGRATKRTR